jgi:Fe-S oxidoreductase
MLPVSQKYAFLIFAAITLSFGLRGFYSLYQRIRRGRTDTESRTDHLPARLRYALTTTLTQARTFRKRTIVSTFHSFIFYGFVFYLLVNLVDAIEGFLPFSITSSTPAGALYNLLADILSLLVLVGVIALVIRRFLLPARRDFRFNASTLLHPDAQHGYITRDSVIVSAFILFHVSSRAIGAGARIAAEGPDPWQPFATALSQLFNAQNAEAWRVFGYWGALGSVLVFLAYFPYTKHVHIFMAPANYLLARHPASGVLPPVEINLEAEDQQVGAKHLEDLAWPRLLDAYACIQCNRCQDVCPATATGKSLSPAALEINKRLELNHLASSKSGFSTGAASPQTLLQFALTPEAAWACTTCGACMQVCPVQDEQMLDIIDIRRNQVMMEGEFPAQLQNAFRGMERAKNPWGINHEQRMQWAEGLSVETIDENPDPDVLYWVGCAASYDPQAQKTARAFVQLLTHANVNFAVLGKKECCTGDSARRAGNEHLYRQLADQNVTTLDAIKPKLIVASCPHCMNAIGKEYRQIGGTYAVMHHTEYLASLVASGKLDSDPLNASITYHDPCYLGRHNGVYEAPRNLLHILGSQVIELDRNRENSFCCGAGGAQFWKEEEEGTERVSENRFREVKQRLSGAEHEKTLAVGCPFCKSMLNSTPGKTDDDGIVVKDVAELLLEGVHKKMGIAPPSPAATAAAAEPAVVRQASPDAKESVPATEIRPQEIQASDVPLPPEKVQRKKWQPATATAKAAPAPAEEAPRNLDPGAPQTAGAPTPARKKWAPKISAATTPAAPDAIESPFEISQTSPEVKSQVTAPERKKWQPKSKSQASETAPESPQVNPTNPKQKS